MAAERETDDGDLLLQCFSQDIKALQAEQCDLSTYAGEVTTRNRRANELCEHLDMILMHKLAPHLPAYWMFVCQFTHSETLKMIRQLPQVSTDRGRGRAWLLLALNEQSLESYIRSFQQNKNIAAQFYESGAIMRSKDKLVLLQTLLSGLEYIVFNLSLDFPYLDVATCDPSVATKIKKNFDTQQQPQEASPIPITNSVHDRGSQDDAYNLAVPSTHGATVREPQEATVTSQPKSNSWEVSLHQGGDGHEMSGKEKVSTSLGSHWEKPLRPTQRGPNAVLLTDSGYSSLDCSPTPQPLLQDLDSFNVVSLKGGRPRLKEGKKPPSTKGVAKSKRPIICAEAPPAHHRLPGEATQQNPELSAGRQAEAVVKPELVISECKKTQVFMQKEADSSKVVGEDGSKELDARVGISDDNVSSPLEPLQPQHDVELQQDPLGIEHDLVSEEEEGLRLRGSEFPPAQVVSVDSTAAPEEDPVESTDGGKAEVIDETQEKSLSVEGSEERKQLQLPEEDGGGGQEEDGVSGASREGGAQSESSNVEQTDKGSSLDLGHHTTDVLSFDVPKRPLTITKQDKFATEVIISQNNKLLLSLNVCFDTSEEMHKLLQVYRFAGPAVLQVCYVLITDEAVYILEDSESEAGYSRLTGARFKDLQGIQVGLNWQSLTLVYGCPPEHHMVVTCNEPVTRGVIECITDVTSKQSPCWGHINMSKDDKARWKALKEILPLESESDLQLYCVAYWEQLEGTMPPPCLFPASASPSAAPLIQGPLLVKTNRFGVQYWKPSFFSLSEDALLQHNSEVDSTIRAKYPIHISSFGGCKRLAKEGRANAFMGFKTEAEMIKWMQAICEAATVQVAGGVTLGGRYGILLTAEMTHVLQEDWQAHKIEQLTCCQLEDVDCVGWDPDIPLYCVLNYDSTESPAGGKGSWLFCFSSSFELGKFEATLAQLWQEKMLVDLEFNVITSEGIKSRARDALELLHASKNRSDSVTKGREYIKPQL